MLHVSRPRIAPAIFTAVFLAACSSSPTTESRTSEASGEARTGQSALDEIAESTADPDDRLRAISERAAEEGSVTLYVAANLELVEPLVAAFGDAHPEVDIEFVRLSSGPLQERVEAEHRARRTIADVVFAPGLPLANLRESAILADHRGVFLPAGFPKHTPASGQPRAT
jgi:ABC-type glycerol-3-phosphate transport system substrate-binding protein